MECNINKVEYFFLSLIWNIAILSAVCFFVGWGLDILGSVFNNEMIRGYAYGVGLLATMSMFWFGLFAAILSRYVKCKNCGSHVITLRYPFVISLTNCKCVNCNIKNT